MDVIVLIIIASVCTVLAPDSKNDALRKCVALIASIAVLLSIIQPIARSMDSVQALPESFFDMLFPSEEITKEIEKNANEWIIDTGIQNIASGVSALVIDHFDLPAGSVVTKIITSEDAAGNIFVAELLLQITSSAECDLSEIEEYISAILECPCRAERIGGHRE